MGVVKMGNIVPKAGIAPTSLAILGQRDRITPCRLPDVTTIPTPSCVCSSLPQRSVQITVDYNDQSTRFISENDSNSKASHCANLAYIKQNVQKHRMISTVYNDKGAFIDEKEHLFM